MCNKNATVAKLVNAQSLSLCGSQNSHVGSTPTGGTFEMEDQLHGVQHCLENSRELIALGVGTSVFRFRKICHSGEVGESRLTVNQFPYG